MLRIIIGISFVSLALAGFVDYWLVMGFNVDGLSTALMEGRGYLVEWIDLIVGEANRGPRFDLGNAQRILGAYAVTLSIGVVSLLSVRRESAQRRRPLE